MKIKDKELVILQSALISVELIIVFAMLLAPVKGVILPVGENVCKAYSLLESTNSGQELIERVRRLSKGSYVYLTLGETEREKLKDYSGKEVRGLTRVITGYSDLKNHIFNTSVITNKDVTGEDPIEILKNIAFELENVAYIYENPYANPPDDSPKSYATQRAVLEELNIY